MSNNFNMATKLNREKQKQKYDLLFNYVKSIDSFANSGNQQQRKSALERYNRSAYLADRQKNMDLNSQVYELIVGGSKGKKKVQWSDQIIVGSVKNKNKHGNLMKGCSNPEQVQKDLLNLQSSIFSTFKIGMDSSSNSPSTIIAKLPQSDSIAFDSKINSPNLQRKCSERSYSGSKRIMRSQSQQLISSRIKKRPDKQVIDRSNKNKQSQGRISSRNPNIQKQLSQRSINQRSTEYTRTVSTERQMFSLMSKRNLPLVRSDSYWKQQTNLMVEIFRNKLNLMSSKH